MSAQVGLDAISYVGSTDIGDVANTWTEIAIVEEATVNLEKNEATVKNRASAWEKVLSGQFVGSVDLTLTHDPSNTEYQALRDAFLDDTDLAVAFYNADIDTTGSEGLQMDAKVMSMQKNEPLEETNTVTFTLRPSAESANEPEWAETV